jgi:hypothetical protein
MLRMPLLEAPTYNIWLLVHFEPAPLIVAVPVEPEPFPRKPLEEVNALPPSTCMLPSLGPPTIPDVKLCHVLILGTTYPVCTIAAQSGVVTKPSQSASALRKKRIRKPTIKPLPLSLHKYPAKSADSIITDPPPAAQGFNANLYAANTASKGPFPHSFPPRLSVQISPLAQKSLLKWPRDFASLNGAPLCAGSLKTRQSNAALGPENW